MFRELVKDGSELFRPRVSTFELFQFFRSVFRLLPENFRFFGLCLFRLF